MSSEYCFNNLKEFDGERIRGTCQTMCPLDEANLRIRERMVHILEVAGTQRKLVKSYSRSAADSNMAVLSHLRPFATLRDTVVHLLFEVTKRVDVPTPVVYDFVNDRIRAVRQDITIQRLAPRQCQELLEPMVRFYVYFGYKLYGLAVKDFDPVLNKKYLLECLKWFLSSADQSQDNMKIYDNGVGVLDDKIKAMTIEDGDRTVRLSCDRVLMESLYIVCNLNDVHPLYRFLNLPKHLKKHPTMRVCYRIALANMKGNYVLVTKLLNKLCPLLHCALCQHLPELQRRALLVMSHAYSSKALTVASSSLRRWLALASVAEARDTSRAYGLTVIGGDVRFNKTQYNTDAPMHQPQIQLLREGIPNANLELVFTYTTH